MPKPYRTSETMSLRKTLPLAASKSSIRPQWPFTLSTYPSLRRCRCGPFLRKRAHKPRSVNHLATLRSGIRSGPPLLVTVTSSPGRSSRAISSRFHAWLCRPSAAAWGSHTFSTPVSAALSIRSVGHLDGLPRLPDIMKSNADYRPGRSLKPGRRKKK